MQFDNIIGQEPLENSGIKEFCKQSYGFTFPMAEKISVKGDDMHSLYKYLKEQAVAKGFTDPLLGTLENF